MRAEWLYWKKRWVLAAFETVMLTILYLATGCFFQYSKWLKEMKMLEIKYQPNLDEALDIYWRCMVADMTNKWFLLLIPIVFVCLTFGQDVTKGRIRLMQRYHISPAKQYLQSFLANYLLCAAAFLVYFALQMHGNYNWEGLVEWSDYPFFLRLIVYSLLLMFFLTAVVQMCCAILGQLHWAAAALVSVGAARVLAKPGVMWINRVLSGGNTAVLGSCTARNYLLYDIRQGVIEKEYAPVISDPELVRKWGELLQLNFLVTGILCLAAGYGFMHFFYRAKKL